MFGQGSLKFLLNVWKRSENFIVELTEAFILICVLNVMSHFTQK